MSDYVDQFGSQDKRSPERKYLILSFYIQKQGLILNILNNIFESFHTQNGDTALHVAARCGFLDTFDRLIEEGAKPEVLNNDGENVLHISVKECHFSIVNKIINYVRKRRPPANGDQARAVPDYDPVKELINQQNKVRYINVTSVMSSLSMIQLIIFSH